jgi:uncharacterized protein YkwD
MMVRRVSVVCVVATLAAIVIAVGALALVPKEAEATLVTVTTCDGGTITLNAEEKYTLELHNKARKKRALKPLCVNPILTRAARAHTQEMLDRDYTSHDSFNGETVKERLQRFGYSSEGYSYYLYGENIAWGCGSYGAPESIFRWWMHSSEHRSNILKKGFREVGLGVMTGTYKSCNQATMYTVDFGVRRR